MLNEKVQQTTNDVIGRLEEIRKSSGDDPSRVWAARNFVHGDYVVDIKVSLRT